MNYIVLDLEWNQSEDGEEENKSLTFEIIEIGAIKLNKERVMVGEFSQLIKPQVYREMHKITSKLIHMQMEELEHGKPFPEVIQAFLEWCGEEHIFCTWGPLDLTELQKNMCYYEMPPLSDRPFQFLDIQKLFSIAFEDGKSRRSLEYAVDELGIDKDIPFHRAFSDAYYTAKILGRIGEEVLKNCSYDIYTPPRSRKEEIFVVFDGYAKYISRVFDDKPAAMADREVISTKCYLCHKNLRKKIRWFTPNGKHYYCIAHCDKHGYMKGKIRIRRAQEDKVYVVKTTKFISAEDADKIRLRQDHAKEMRRRKKQKGQKS